MHETAHPEPLTVPHRYPDAKTRDTASSQTAATVSGRRVWLPPKVLVHQTNVYSGQRVLQGRRRQEFHRGHADDDRLRVYRKRFSDGRFEGWSDVQIDFSAESNHDAPIAMRNCGGDRIVR